MLRKALATGVLALGAVAFAGTAQASTVPVVGSYTVADNGQGCWTGGGLLADGTATDPSGGACSFKVPLPDGTVLHEQLKFTSKTWTNNGDGTVTLCATVAPTHTGSDPLGIAPNLGCTPPIPYNVGPVKIQGTLYRVDLKG